jgi:hypothetical protein
MADDQTTPGPAEQLRANFNEDYEDYELASWTVELGVTPERLRQLVNSHGVMTVDIRRELGK